jgi:hypothetical protein
MPPFGVFSNIFGGNNSITMRNGHMTENAGKRFFGLAMGAPREATRG